MIIDERITTYLHSLESDNNVLLERMRVFAAENDVPIIRREMESFIKILLMLKAPFKILEVGTGIAYSAIFMAENSDAHITTIENYEKRIIQAKKFIGDADMNDRITLVEGDARKVVPDIDENFDFIFMDAAKAQYIELLPDVLRMLKGGGILLADNVLQDGDLIESRFVTERRQRTIHERMRSFLYEVKHNEELVTSIITIGDGVSLSVKK